MLKNPRCVCLKCGIVFDRKDIRQSLKFCPDCYSGKSGESTGNKFEDFGKAVLERTFTYLHDGAFDIDIEEILLLAKTHFLAEKIPFDKAKHRDLYEGEEGDNIWVTMGELT